MICVLLLFSMSSVGLAANDGLGMLELSGDQGGLSETTENESPSSPSPLLREQDNTDAEGTSIIEDAMEIENDNQEGLLEDIEAIDDEDAESVVEAADEDMPSPTEVFFTLQTLFYLTIGLFLLFPLLAFLFAIYDKVKELGKETKEELEEDFEKHPEDENDHELKSPDELIEDARKAIDELPK